MEVILSGNKIILTTDDGIKIDNISAYFDYSGYHANVIRVESSDWRYKKQTEHEIIVTDGKFTLSFTSDGKYTYVQGKYFSTKNVRGGVKLCILKGCLNNRVDGIYMNSGTGFYDVSIADMQGKTIVKPTIKNQREESLDLGIALSTKNNVLCGAVTYEKTFSSVEICENGMVDLCSLLYAKPVFENEVVESDKFVVFGGNNLSEMLSEFASKVKQNGEEKQLDFDLVKSGWCSWYYYGPNISEQIILDNIEQLKKRKIDVDCIQIDDGWNINRGEWEANERFPHGMKWLADKIKQEGFIPGIWVAPLTATRDSKFLKENKDMFTKCFDSDEPYGLITLDLSTKKAQEYLYNLFYKLTHEWGYRYIKYDFICYGMTAGKYHDPTFNGVKNYHKALEIMRSAVTDDTCLMSCTSPLYASLGKTHALRVSRDIFERWDSVKSVAAHVLHRLHLNDYIRIDPDCALLRTSKNEDEQCFRKCTRTEKEIETYLTLLGVSGGVIMLSDKVELLDDEQLKKFSYLFPVNDVSGKAVDLGGTAIPTKIDCGNRNGIRTVVFFNWEDLEETYEFSLGKKCVIYDFWAKEFLQESDCINLTVKPHECKVLQCSEVKKEFSIVGAENRLVPNFNIVRNGNVATFTQVKVDENIICRYDGKIDAENAIVNSVNNIHYVCVKKDTIRINMGG